MAGMEVAWLCWLASAAIAVAAASAGLSEECGGHTQREDCQPQCDMKGRPINGGPDQALACRTQRCTRDCVAEFGGPIKEAMEDCGDRLEVEVAAMADARGLPSADFQIRLLLLQSQNSTGNSSDSWLPGALKLELECVFDATPGGDFCLHGSRTAGNLSEWPCRSMEWESSELRPVLPAALAYPCFRLAPASILRLNLTLFAHHRPRCRNSYFAAIQHAVNMNPKRTDQWLPTGFVDVSPKDKVWIRWTRPPRPVPQPPMLILVKRLVRHSDAPASHQLIENATMGGNRTGVAIGGLEAGEYVAELRPLFAPPAQPLMLSVPFLLAEDKNSAVEGKPLHLWFHDHLHWVIALLAVGIITILLLVLAAAFRKLRNRDGRRAREFFELREKPKVLLLYSDDHSAQRGFVVALAQYLEERGNCDVLLDEWALSACATSPDRWYLGSLAAASATLVLLSPAALAALEGRGLVNHRPWVPMFPSITHALLNRLRQELDARPASNAHKPLRSAAWLSLEHQALSLPPHLKHLPVPHHRLPTQLRQLLAQLHGVEPDLVSPPLNDAQLRSAAAAAAEWEEEEPEWLAAKLALEAAPPPPLLPDSAQLDSLPPPPSPTQSVSSSSASRFPLLPPPPPDSSDPAESHFPLLRPPPPHSDDDSDSDFDS